MLGWIIKMLLKVMKPFAKAMIWEAIFDYLSDVDWEEEEEVTELETETAAE